MEFMPRRKSLSSKSLQRRRSLKVMAKDSPSTITMTGSSADDARISSDNENMPVIQPTSHHGNTVLKDVVAFVEVRTKTENRSNSVKRQLELLGAVVVKKFITEEPVTHVVWKDGNQSTREKAIKRGLHLVSVLWVDSCKQKQQHADEALFPITSTVDSASIVIPKPKRLRSMQPKSFKEDVESSTERINRKRKKKELVHTPRLYPGSPGPGAIVKPFVYVEETQDPNTPVGTTPVPGVGGTPSLIPDTPASMRVCLDALSRVHNSRNTPTSVSAKLVVGESPTSSAKADILQKKLSFSPTSESKNAIDGTNDSGGRGKTSTKKGRRSECGQVPAVKDSAKVRRLSLRIEKTLKEQDADEDPLNSDTDEPTHSEKSQSESIRGNGSSHTKKTSPDKDQLSHSESKVNSKVNSIVLPEEEACSHNGSSVRRKRKLLSSTTDGIPSQFITAPTRSSKKERQRKQPRLSGNTSRNLGDGFAMATDSSNNRSADSRRGDSCDHDVEAIYPRDGSPEREGKTAQTPKGDRGSRKRKKEDLSPGLLTDENGKSAKRQKDDADVFPPVETSAHPRGDTVRTSRKSPDDFAPKSGRHRTKADRAPRKHRPASVSTLSVPSARKAVDDPAPEKSHTDKKTGRSQSLTTGPARGSDQTRPGNRSWLTKLPKRSRSGLGELDDSSDSSSSSSAGTRRVESRGGDKATKKLKFSKSSLVMTSVHGEDQDLITSVVKTLGRFSMEDHVSVATTHVVCGESRRTLNLLRGIARGCWVLSMEWVLKSLEVGEWLPEAPYEIQEPFPAAMISRRERESARTSSYKQALFSSLGSVYVGDRTSPPRPCLCELLVLCGGTVTVSVGQANLCIGSGDGNQTDDTRRAVSEKWLLDCITQHKQLAFDDYYL